MTGADEMLDLARRFVGAIERGDTDAVRACYHPDARIWHNNDGVEQTVDENMKVLGWMARTLPTREYVVSQLDALPDGFVQQHVLRATLPSGGTWELPACVIVRVRDGLIVRLDEYLDSAHVARLTEALARG
ncbi:MAG: nuclear transport factor 2 family protein [Ilumatobacteraceae bacterium]